MWFHIQKHADALVHVPSLEIVFALFCQWPPTSLPHHLGLDPWKPCSTVWRSAKCSRPHFVATTGDSGRLVHQHIGSSTTTVTDCRCRGFCVTFKLASIAFTACEGLLLVALPVDQLALPFAPQVWALSTLCGQGLSCEHFARVYNSL